MRVGLKKRSAFGVKKVLLEGKIEKIEKKKSAVNPEKETLSVFFKGLEGLGVVSFAPKEIEMLEEKLSARKKSEKASKPKAKKKSKKKKA